MLISLDILADKNSGETAVLEAQTEIRKSILIIKSQVKSLSSVETFLRNREWHIHVATDLKSALVYLVQNKPSFVMISMDHPNKKVRALPKLLAQAFPVFVIAFTESSTTTAYKHLLDSGCQYRINPPVTGPAVERTINKIIKDQQEAAEKAAQANLPKAEGEPSEGPTVVKGRDLPDPMSSIRQDTINISGAGPGSHNISSASDILRQLSESKEEGDDDETASLLSAIASGQASQVAGTGAKGGGLLIAKGSANSGPGMIMPESNSGSGIAYRPGEPNSNSPAGTPASGQAPSSAAPGMFYDPQAGDKGPAGIIDSGANSNQSAPPLTQAGQGPGAKAGIDLSQADPSKGPTILGSEGSGLLGKAHAPVAKDLKPSSGMDVGEGPEAGSAEVLGTAQKPQTRYSEDDVQDSGRSTNDSEGNKAPPRIGSGPQMIGRAADPVVPREIDENRDHIRENLNLEVRTVGGSKDGSGWAKEENIMVRGTQKALDDSVNIKDGKVEQKLEENTNVACLVIESAKFSGYLVAAMGKNRRIDQKFVSTIRERLSKFLAENGEPIKDKESLGIKIKQVDFEDWALEYADFLRKSVHEGEEVAMAFFPFAEASTEVLESASADMGSVKIDELKGDIPVEFNLYIYLPTNKKYVLYTPRGSKFYGNQKGRLETMGVTHMHVKRTELQDVSKYRAQNYLNSKIEEFQAKQRSRKAKSAS